MTIPAAQYLRMSTEHQRYSFDNQIAAIKGYADRHNFVVTETYSDSAKSGLMFRNRAALPFVVFAKLSKSGSLSHNFP